MSDNIIDDHIKIEEQCAEYVWEYLGNTNLHENTEPILVSVFKIPDYLLKTVSLKGSILNVNFYQIL